MQMALVDPVSATRRATSWLFSLMQVSFWFRCANRTLICSFSGAHSVAAELGSGPLLA
jgi:hypothetical protein